MTGAKDQAERLLLSWSPSSPCRPRFVIERLAADVRFADYHPRM